MESGNYRISGSNSAIVGTLRVAHVCDLHYKYRVECALRISVAQLSASHIQEVPLKELCSGAVCT